MRTRYEYLCSDCGRRFVSDEGRVEDVVCPRCQTEAVTLTALVVGGQRRSAVTSLVAYQGGRRWLGGCCSG